MLLRAGASTTAITRSPSPSWNRFCAAVSRSFGSSCTAERYARPRSVKNNTPDSADVSINRRRSHVAPLPLH